MPNRTCSIDDCGSPVVGRGWCNKHYCRWRVHGDPLGQVVRQAVCAIDGCEKPFCARGWCQMHWQRWKNHGHPLAIPDKSVPNRYEVKHGVGIAVVTRRDGSEYRFRYDLADHDLIASRTWFITEGGYIVRNSGGGRGNARLEFLHRVLLGLSRQDPRLGDHIDGDRTNNQRLNLRIADSGLNGENRAVVNEVGTSRYRGVCWDKTRAQWKAYTRINGVMHNVGRYPTQAEAADAIARYRTDQGVSAGYPRRHPDTPSRARRKSA